MKVLLRCGDSDTGCGERGLTHMSAHTRTLRVTEREVGHWGSTGPTHQHSGLTRTQGGLARPSGPVTRRARRKPGEADGGAGADRLGWGEGCHCGLRPA